MHVVTVNPTVRVSLAAPAEVNVETLSANFDDIGPDIKVGSDLLGFSITGVERQLITDVAFAEFGTSQNRSVVGSVTFLYQFVRDVSSKFRPLA